MILPNVKSTIVNLKEEFTLNPNMITPNTFIPLGKSAKGFYHVVLLFGRTVDWTKLSIHESQIQTTPEFCHYFICGIEGAIIGSLFNVSQNKLTVTPNRLSAVRKDHVTDFKCVSENGAGGVLSYTDSSENVLVIPIDIYPNSFLVSI